MCAAPIKRAGSLGRKADASQDNGSHRLDGFLELQVIKRLVMLLGLQAHQVMGTPVIASCGLAFHLIELADTHALGEVCLSATHWDESVSPSGVEQVYLYVGPTPGEEGAVLRTRMFCREHGLCEDAATGSAAAALSGYLATTGSARRWNLHQGVEMGRPSEIHTNMQGDRVQVGGQAVVVGKGEFYLS